MGGAAGGVVVLSGWGEMLFEWIAGDVVRLDGGGCVSIRTRHTGSSTIAWDGICLEGGGCGSIGSRGMWFDSIAYTLLTLPPFLRV